MENPLYLEKGEDRCQEWCLRDKAVRWGVGGAMLLQRCHTVEVPVPPWLLWGLGTGWGSGSISVLLQPGTSKQPSNLAAYPYPCGVLSGCFGVLTLPELSTTLRGLNSRKTSSHLFGQNYMEPNLVCVPLKLSFVWGLSKARHRL